MAFPQFINQIFKKEVGSLGGNGASNMLLKRWPAGTAANPAVATAAVAITAGATPTYSAWTQIVAAAKITNPTWIASVSLTVGSPAVGAAEDWLVDLGFGAGGSETSFSTGTINQGGLCNFPQFFKTDVGQNVFLGTYNLPVLLGVSGAPRIAAAISGLVTGGKAAAIAFYTLDGVGT